MFLQSCYIRKNSEGLRRILDDMGYFPICEYEPSDCGLYVFDGAIQTVWGDGCFDGSWDFGKAIDCGTNEDMFLALAALNDETDQYQWFVIDGKWHFCNYDLIEEYLHEEWGEFDYSELHKATADEIVEHFKNDLI